MTENSERLVRVETAVEHIEKKVDTIASRQINHEQTTGVSFAELRENAVRQQLTTENLVQAIREQQKWHHEQDEKVEKRVTVLEDKLSKLYIQVIGITVGGGLIWLLLGKKILALMGLV